MRAALPTLLLLVLASAPADADRAPADVDQTIRKHAGKLQACYRRELDREPSLKRGGKVLVKFSIGRDGTTSRVRIDVKSTLRHDRLSSCIVGVFRSMKFGNDGTEARVNYPLLFSAP